MFSERIDSPNSAGLLVGSAEIRMGLEMGNSKQGASMIIGQRTQNVDQSQVKQSIRCSWCGFSPHIAKLC